jgi:hypothetical protein
VAKGSDSIVIPSILQQSIVAIVSLEIRTFCKLDSPFDKEETTIARWE